MSKQTDKNRSSSWNSGGQGGSNSSGYNARGSGSQDNNLFSPALSSYQSTPTFTYGYHNGQPIPKIVEPFSAPGDISQSPIQMPLPALQLSQQNANIAYTCEGSFYYPDVTTIQRLGRSDLPPSTQPPGVLIKGPVDEKNRPMGATFGSFIVYPGLPSNIRNSFINYIMNWLTSKAYYGAGPLLLCGARHASQRKRNATTSEFPAHVAVNAV